MFPGAHATLTPDKPAIVMGRSGLTISYLALDREATRLANALRESGLRPGDHVAFCLTNHPRFLPVMWGAHYAGLHYTPIGSRLTAEEIAYIVEDCGARAFITERALASTALDLLEMTPGVELRLMVDGAVSGYDSYEAVVDAASAIPADNRPEGHDMPYSSGTTGRPKGVKVVVADTQLGDPDPSAMLCQELFDVAGSTVYLSPAPLYHAAPLRFCRAVQRSGGTVVVMEEFDAEGYLALVERHAATFTQLVPTMFVRLLKLPEDARAGYDVSSLQTVVHAAAPCPIDVKRAMIEWWGPIVHEYYGGTEGNGFVYCDSEQWLAHPGTVGKAITGTIRILDDDGVEQPAGEPGTVYFEDGGVFEYHNDVEKTRGSTDPGGRGWTTLGDVGRVDEDGYLYLTDRKAYLIIVGGVNVYPQEAENTLAMHPAVADVAVFGIPNAEFGEEVKAAIEPADPAAAGPQLEAELIEYCRARLAHVKCPRSIDFRSALPRLETGKLHKRLLRDEYWAGAARSI